MTVAQLIAILQTQNPNAKVLTEKDVQLNGGVCEVGHMGEPINVYAGVAYKVGIENCGFNTYVADEQWRFAPFTVNAGPVGAVYIGFDNGVVGPLWTRLSPI